MNHNPAADNRMTDADEHEWLAQERAWRDERSASPTSDDALATGYRAVVRALRTPLPDALPANFADRVAAQCRQAAARVDTRWEVKIEQLLVVVLVAAALVVCVLHGGEWLHASVAALPMLDRATTLDWSTALAACLGLSWAMDAIGRRRVMH